MFFASAALFIYCLYVSHSLFLKICLGALFVFMLLAIIGITISSNQSSSLLTGGEASRQQGIMSSPVMAFFGYLFNDTGSSNPMSDVAQSIASKFDPQTYFSQVPDLLPLAQQIANGSSDLTETLKDNPQLSKGKTSTGYTLLYFAVLNVNSSSTAQLLAAGADPNQLYIDQHGQSYVPLTYLLDNYTSLGSAHPDENTVLTIIDILSQHGAKLNFPYSDEYGTVQAPIFYVKLNWEENLLKKLVDDGADINAPGWHGQTLLYETISPIPDPEYIKFLLDLGADPKHKSIDGTTPVDAFCNWVTHIQKEGHYDSLWQTSAQQVAQLFTSKGVVLSCKI